MLSVDVDQEFADILELLDRGGTAVDPGARSPGCIDHATQQAAVLIGKLRFLEHPAHGRRPLDRERRSHLGLFAALADQGRLGALAEHHRQRVDQDGLAGPRFAGKRGKSASELKVEPLDDDEVTNAETEKHE